MSFLTNKGYHDDGNDILLHDESKLVHDPELTSNIFNDYYVNITSQLGLSDLPETDACPSVLAINDRHNNLHMSFSFQPTTVEHVAEKLHQLNSKKATGFDHIPAKLLKVSADIIAPSLTAQINNNIATSCFPTELKTAQVIPVYKKKDPLDKANYRPVSILPALSKIFERILADQMMEFFSAFRKGISCQSILLKMMEDWRKALDDRKYVGAVLMDLSKAFDCMPHNLLLAKLQAYGLSNEAITLMRSYLTGRRQRVKIGSTTSSWLEVKKGVPQGSILGPLLFNVFINDFFYVIDGCNIYNYADDNTLSVTHSNQTVLATMLQGKAEEAIDWFSNNAMAANPDKFQAILLAPSVRETLIKPINIKDSIITTAHSVNILGIEIEDKLKFNTHINSICRKAARQLNVLRRLSSLLDQESRMAIFRAFIVSNFNYCPLVWHFCGKRNTSKIEKLQERALRFVFNDFTSSYENMLKKAELTTLTLSRIKTLALEVYKALHGHSPPYMKDMFTSRQEQKHSLRNEHQLNIPFSRTVGFGSHSIQFEGARVWNHLPNKIRCAENLASFKKTPSNMGRMSLCHLYQLFLVTPCFTLCNFFLPCCNWLFSFT